MRNRHKTLAAVTVAGLVAAGGAAFTATGLSYAGDGQTKFIGGTVSESLTGATLSSIGYTYANASHVMTTGVTLTFGADAAGKAASVVVNGGSSVSCGAVDVTTYVATCDLSAGGGVGINSLAVTVA